MRVTNFCLLVIAFFTLSILLTSVMLARMDTSYKGLIIATTTPSLKDTGLKVEVTTTGLSLPTSMAFIDSDDILVLEKNKGTVQRVKDGIILPQPLLDVNVATESERGMLGIDIVQIQTPILPQSARLFSVFLYYTESELNDGGTAIANRLYKYSFIDDPRLGPAQGKMFAPKLLLDLPVTPGPNHDGGKVVIGPDKNVYTVIGDLNRQTQAQNFEDGAEADGTGGILRVRQDGTTVDVGILGNTHPLNKYFGYGIRNSFGIEFDPVTGKMWDTENGPASNDEINFVEPGFNSGWRDLMGIAPEDFDFESNLVSFDGKGHYRDPEFVWSQVVAPTAVEFLSSNKLGTQYQNDMFVGDFNNGRIYNFNLNAERNGLILGGVLSDKVADNDGETEDVIFGEGFGGISDLKVGTNDGYLYVLSITRGTIYKILPN
jgi:glucose/arabinose dehydrogenase